MRLLFACAGALTIAAPAMAAADGQPLYGYGYAQPQSAADTLANYVRTLASDPKDFGALIGAGKAAISIGDPQAAAGFFARADEVNPRSPLPQAGMGAVSVANGEPRAAMPYFARALKLGAALSQIGCDRGLAYDLLGQQAQAQADYRAALTGADGDEARRRLALSLAISGDKAGALAALSPLMAAGDPSAARARAFVLALTGDANGAMAAIDAAMPGSWARVSPFFKRLPTLAAAQKAAAVNLGIFPDSSQPAYAAAATTTATVPNYGMPTTLGVAGSVSTDRLSGIEALLHAPAAAPEAVAQQPVQQPSWQPPQAPQPTRVSYATPSLPTTAVRRAPPPPPASVQRSRLWLQLASGSNAGALQGEFRRMKSRNRDLFDGISGYVARSPDRARLVIGPFRGSSDAEIFAEDLHTVGVDAFSWTNSPSDQIVPLGTE